MEGDDLKSNENQNVGKSRRSRRSIFLPEVSVSNTTEIKTNWDEEYLKKLKLEEKTWKQLYEEQKQRRVDLLKELEIKAPEEIDYSLFSEEEIEYLNSGPNIAEFVKEAKDLQNLIKTVTYQSEKKKEKYKIMLENMERSWEKMKSILLVE